MTHGVFPEQFGSYLGKNILGDAEKGLIKGFGIEAHYLLQEDILTVNILRKPLLLSWAKLEQKVRTLVNIKPNTS